MEHDPEQRPDPIGDPIGEATEPEAAGSDRDLSTLEALEGELATLEGELERVERAGAARSAPDGEAAAEPPS